jgi:hypothetical protein
LNGTAKIFTKEELENCTKAYWKDVPNILLYCLQESLKANGVNLIYCEKNDQISSQLALHTLAI